MSNKIRFIVIEGLDGSGKSTASRLLKKELQKKFKVKSTYQPHNPSCGGEYIRDVLQKKIKKFTPLSLAMAYFANRFDHISRVINPWLDGGEDRILICDRYYLSSFVYQTNKTFTAADVWRINKAARKPDVIFFLNVSNEVCFERLQKRNEPKEIFDDNVDENRKKYFKAIDFLKKKNDENIVEIDGNGTIQETVDQMLKVILRP